MDDLDFCVHVKAMTIEKIKSLFVLLVLVLLFNDAATFWPSLSCQCGWTNSDWRIVGGNETLPNQYPWMASLQYPWGHFCGGSIITPWHILTAAHCISKNERTLRRMKLILGAHNIKIKTAISIEIPIARFIVHEKYNDENKEYHYDIAILVTRWKIPFNKYIGPVCMPTRQLNLVDQSVKLAGWGYTKADGSSSDVLLEIDLKVISTERCYDWIHWEKIRTYLKQKICTFGSKKYSCLGDSGSPMIWLDPHTNRYTQVALSSYSWGCTPKNPTVNTDVTTYVDWINKLIEATKPGVKVCSRMF